MYEAAINTCSNSELPLFRLAIVDQCGWGSAAADVVIRIDCNRIVYRRSGEVGSGWRMLWCRGDHAAFSPHHSIPLLVLYANDRNVTSCCRRQNRQGDKWTRSGTQQGEHDHEHGHRHGHGHLMVAEHVGDSWQQLSNMCGQVVNQE